MHPVTFSRPPDKTLRDASLFDVNWERKAIDAYGTQASTELHTSGETDGRGLNITAIRATAIAELGNGITVEITNDTSLALTWDATTRVLGGTLRNATTMTQLKAAVDGLTGCTLSRRPMLDRKTVQVPRLTMATVKYSAVGYPMITPGSKWLIVQAPTA